MKLWKARGVKLEVFVAFTFESVQPSIAFYKKNHKYFLWYLLITFLLIQTAFTTQWLLYLLAKYPESQQRLYDQVRNLESISAVENQFLKGFLRETLRLYPVAPFITRYMPEDVKIDGYDLNKGVSLCFPLL